MSSEYNYDPDAQFFPFFILTITSLVTLPLTYSLLRTPTPSTGSSSKASHITSPHQPPHADLIEAQRAKQKRKDAPTKRILTTAAGWALMAYMVYLVYVTARATPTVWNPYDILDIGMSASEKQINSRYRRLSVTMHPDKRQPNAALNETAEMVNDQWVEIVKAYKALTDEDIRNNYIQYGNPDGKQSTSFGIALPSFLVSEGAGKYVLVLYGLLLGIGLPWLVGKWWYGMQKMTRERVLVTSAGNMFREYRERMDEGDVAAVVSSAMEYRDVLHGSKEQSGLSKVESKLVQAEEGAGLLPKDKKKLEELEDPVRRKTLALVWAYLHRLDLDDKTLEAEKYELAPTALQMNEAFLSICLAYGFTAPVLASYHLSQSLIQATPPTDRLPLLQLPHFTPSIVAQIEQTTATSTKNGGRGHTTIQSFMALPPEHRQALAQAAGLTNDRLKAAENVARQLPLLSIETHFFKVQGERHIIPSSLVQFVLKTRFIPPGTKDIPALNDKDLLDIDPPEGDIMAQKKEQEQHPVPLAHAPYFPGPPRAPRYHVFLTDHRQGKIAVPPFTFSSFDKRAFDEEGKPTFNVVTLKMQFQAPPQAGEFKFGVRVVCDAYLGFDWEGEAVLRVEDASMGREVESDDEISEPEEDSIAGQMAALKGQPTASDAQPRRPRKAIRERPQGEESDYESGTDEDEESESETDTDTDSEGE